MTARARGSVIFIIAPEINDVLHDAFPFASKKTADLLSKSWLHIASSADLVPST